jgi:hypothetical protein
MRAYEEAAPDARRETGRPEARQRRNDDCPLRFEEVEPTAQFFVSKPTRAN